MFSLLTEEYDSLTGSFQSSHTTETRPLTSTTWTAAEREARQLYQGLKRYKIRNWDRSMTEYPRNPRLVMDLLL